MNFPSDLDTWPPGIQELVRENYRHPGGRGYQDYDGYWNAFIYGDAERGVERVRHLQASGFQNVLIGFSFGGMPYDRGAPLDGAVRGEGDAAFPVGDA